MANLPGGFNAADHGEMADFSPLQDGDYLFQVTASEMVLTKKAKEARNPSLGQFLKLTMDVIDGKMKGRKIWRNLNLINPSADAVKIANEELATLARAMGVTGAITDSQQLHGKPFVAKVKIQKGKNGNPDSNSVNKYLSADSYTRSGGGEETLPSESSAPAMEEGEAPKKKRQLWDE